MEDIVEGWKRHNQTMKELGLPGMSKEEYIASLQRVSLEEHEYAIHATLRNLPAKKPLWACYFLATNT
jgi:hypothetical protein